MDQENLELQAGRDLHRVCTKAVIYTPNKSHVLVMHMYKGTSREMYGLPGGHIDAGELPDDTIVREIKEELGVTISGLRHCDFFVHENGKVVLVYIGTLPLDVNLVPSDPAKEIGTWLTREEFKAIVIDPGYNAITLNNW